MTPDPDTLRWTRTSRRSGEIVRDGYGEWQMERVVGPWHVEARLGLTWCGAYVSRLVAARTITLPVREIPEGRRCDRCETAMNTGRPVPFRRNRR